MSASDLGLQDVCGLNHASDTTTKLSDRSEDIEQCSLISTLPVDLLWTIFLMASMDDRRGKMRIAITHVCHFWRETAVSLSLMWSTIHISPSATGKEWSRIGKFLSRSKDAPLSIFVEKSLIYRDNRRLQRFITKSLPTVRELTTQADIFQQVFCPAPILESLVLAWDQRDDIQIPETIFNGHTPCLRKVTLRNVEFSLRSTFLNDLTELSIGGSTFYDTDPILLLDCLAKIPGLQKLKINPYTHSGPARALSFGSRPSRNLVLPSLRSFTFSKDLELLSLILDNLAFPQKLHHIELSFRVDCHALHSPSLSKVVSFVAEHCSGTPNATLKLVGPNPNYQILESHELEYGQGSSSFHIMILGPVASPISLIETLHAGLPLKDIVDIQLKGDFMQWSRLYRRIENTRSLTVSPLFTDAYFLHAPANDLLQELAAYDFWPRLQNLIIGDVDCRRLSDASGGPTFAQIMRPCLESRSRAGIGIKELHIISKDPWDDNANHGEVSVGLKGLVDDIYVYPEYIAYLLRSGYKL